MSFPEAARIQPIKKSLSVKAKRMAVTMALPRENKKLEAGSSSQEAKMAMETKAKQRATGQEVWLPWRAQHVGAKLLGPGQFEQPHTALAEVWHGAPLHRPLHGQLQRWRSCGGSRQLSALRRL